MNYSAPTQELRNHLGRGIGVKWSYYPPDVIPMWIADMDFGIASEIRDHMCDLVENYGLGYSSQGLHDAVIREFENRYRQRYDVEVSSSNSVLATDVVQGIYFCISTMSSPGDHVVIQNPVYPPFMAAILDLKRQVTYNQLILNEDGYLIDFELLEKQLSDSRTKLMLFCNPQNPTGRVFTLDELSKVASLAAKYNVTVISDEIHADLTYAPNVHVPFAVAGVKSGCSFVILTSASKSFNLAGLKCAVVYFSDEATKAKYDSVPYHMRGAVSNLGMAGTIAAWTKADQWFNNTLERLSDNRELLNKALAEIPDLITCEKPEGTFLAWLNFGQLSNKTDPAAILLTDAKVALSPGPDFGPGGTNFARLNFATTESNLNRALESIIHTVKVQSR